MDYDQLAQSAAVRLKFEINAFPPEQQSRAFQVIVNRCQRMMVGENVIIDGPGLVRDITPRPQPEPKEEPIMEDTGAQETNDPEGV